MNPRSSTISGRIGERQESFGNFDFKDSESKKTYLCVSSAQGSFSIAANNSSFTESKRRQIL